MYKISVDIEFTVNFTPEKDFLIKNGWNKESVSVSGVASDPLPAHGRAEHFRTKYGISAEAPVVLFMGRKIFNKGVTHLVQAMDMVWNHHPAARLILAGFSHNPAEWLDGYLARCGNDARQKTLNLDDVDDDLRESALEACNVMVLPSISDSFGIAFLDAWRHGKPVIGCRDTCAESFIEQGGNGLLVEFGDTRGMADSISMLLDQPAHAVEMGLKGFELWSAKFQSSVIAGETEALFERLMRINFMGVIHGIDAVRGHFLAQGAGEIIITASVAGFRGLPNTAPYGATKAALINMAESLAPEFAQRGVALRVINPGFVRTPLTDKNDFEMPGIIEPEEAARLIIRKLNLSGFELLVPTSFGLVMKLIRILPYRLFFALTRRMLKK